MKGISVAEFGAPDVMKLADIAIPQPNDGEVLVKVYAAGSLLSARERTCIPHSTVARRRSSEREAF